MELKQLRRFLVVAETKNFHSASEILNITQPALSQSIHKLEESVGEALFLRGPGGVELTEVGELLIPRAKLILKFREAFLHEVGELQNRRNAQIKIGVAPYFARDIFPQALSRFSARMPDTLIDISEEYTTELLHAMEHGALDMAFCGLNGEAWPNNIIDFEHLYYGKFSLFARTEHPIFAGTKVADLLALTADYPWAVHDRNISGGYFERIFERKGLTAPRFSVQTHSLHVITATLCASDRIALIADDFARSEVRSGRIKKIEQADIDITTDVGIFSLRDEPKSPALAALINELRNVCKERDHL